MDLLIPTIVGVATVAGLVVIAPTVKFALDLAPFLNTNTRCSARNGLLLTKKNYDDLINASSRKEIFALLEETPYSYIVEHAEFSEYLGKALTENNLKSYRWLEDIVPSQMVPIIKAISLKFEIMDIKTVINCMNTCQPGYCPVAVSDVELRTKLEDSKDFSQVVQALEKTQYKDMFAGKTLGDLAQINFMLDKFYYEHVFNEIQKVKEESIYGSFLRYWRSMIDIANIRMAMRNMDSKEDIPLIDGGLIEKEQLADLTDLAQLETLISNTVYADYIKKCDSSCLEHGFHSYLKGLASELQAKYTLKSGTVVKYLILKELEIRNLKIILKLKKENFKADEIKELVVM